MKFHDLLTRIAIQVDPATTVAPAAGGGGGGLNLNPLKGTLTGPVLAILCVVAGLTMINRASHMDHRGQAVHTVLLVVGIAVVALGAGGGAIKLGEWGLSQVGLGA